MVRSAGLLKSKQFKMKYILARRSCLVDLFFLRQK